MIVTMSKSSVPAENNFMTLEQQKEKIFNELTDEQEEELQTIFMEEREIGGIPIMKDNCEDLFENWLESLTVMDLEKYLEL